MSEWPSRPVTIFHERALPEKGTLAGYAALIERYGLKLPLPARLAAIAERYHPLSTDEWLLLTPRHRPEPTLSGQLSFALKWEGVQLPVLAQLVRAVPSAEFVDLICSSPTGTFARRIWFLFEWITGEKLPIPDPGRVKLTPVVDPDQQFALGTGQSSPRHKVLNNLPGTPAFCPMVNRTPLLVAQSAKALDQRARIAIGRIRPDLVARAAAFLLLNDSKSSFAIEGERPSGTRTARWGQAIAQAGNRQLSLAELDRLQRIVIGDDRFVQLGLRAEGGFVGVHDRLTNEPIPDHVSARPEDLEGLVGGLIGYDERTLAGQLDPVVAAAALAFGFVYIHPYEDGNGRLHRWLIHHALAAAHYNPPGLVFPISAVILRRLDEYKGVLESYSRPLLPFIDWRATPKGNVEVRNDTADFYRYFDATAHAEFLYSCVEQTIQQDLPEEVAFLEAFERFSDGVQEIVDMPASRIELLRKFLEQGQGRISQRAREREFAALTAAEAQRIERLYDAAFAPPADPGDPAPSL